MNRDHVYIALGHGFLLQLSAAILASVGHFLVQDELVKTALAFLSALLAVVSTPIIIWSYVLYLICYFRETKQFLRGEK